MVASGLVVLLVGAMAEPPGFKGHDRPVSYWGGGLLIITSFLWGSPDLHS